MTIRSAAPILAALAAVPAILAPHASAQVARPEDDEVVVTSERQRGSVQADVPPETTLNAADVRSFGATNIFQLLARVAPQTGSASIRGGGAPIVLINGRRISGFQEVRDLPPDVVSRVEVFDEQLSLQYGFTPDQRVVNLVLERRYSGGQVEGDLGQAGEGARTTARGEARFTDINEGNRTALGLSYDAADAITELDRGIAPPLSGPDFRAERTLAPETSGWRGNASFARALDERLTGQASIRAETTEQRSLLGRDAALALRVRDAETETVRGALAFDGAISGWQWTATATGDLLRQDSTTSGALAPSIADFEQRLYDVTANVNGAIFDLPAGRVRTAFRFGYENRAIESFSRQGLTVSTADLSRTTPSARATLTVPITNRRREFGAAFGDISVNATGSWSDPSDVAALNSFGFGGSWAPTRALRVSAQVEQSEAAPTLQQLGDAILVTPDVAFFDPIRGETVRVTRTTGGNPGLAVEERDDLVVNASWAVQQVQGLSLSASWARNDSTNVAVALPTALPETTAAFPGRFTRDLTGALIAVDARPIALAARDIETVRYGLTFSRAIGASQPPRAPAGSERPAGRPGGGSNVEGAIPGARGETAGAGRWNVSVFHRVRLADNATLVAGQAPIDLLDRGGLDRSGETRSALEFEGGVFYRGLGLRFSGGWTDGYTIPIASGGALNFSDRWTLNARTFVNFDARPGVIEAAPLLKGSRVTFAIDNITDSAVEVRDETGVVPIAYQDGFINPLGRVFQIGWRKQF